MGPIFTRSRQVYPGPKTTKYFGYLHGVTCLAQRRNSIIHRNENCSIKRCLVAIMAVTTSIYDHKLLWL